MATCCAGLQVLQDSMTGTSKVLMVCNVSPEASSVTETVSTLTFAQRANQVRVDLGFADAGHVRFVTTIGLGMRTHRTCSILPCHVPCAD
jgi:hypothetical protein